jgi:hypothetical protein
MHKDTGLAHRLSDVALALHAIGCNSCPCPRKPTLCRGAFPLLADVKVFVDPKAVMYLVGSVMDFVEDAVRAEFVFQNPNAKGACGCGESFNV